MMLPCCRGGAELGCGRWNLDALLLAQLPVPCLPGLSQTDPPQFPQRIAVGDHEQSVPREPVEHLGELGGYRTSVVEVDPSRLGDPADVDPVQGQRLLQPWITDRTHRSPTGTVCAAARAGMLRRPGTDAARVVACLSGRVGWSVVIHLLHRLIARPSFAPSSAFARVARFIASVSGTQNRG